MPSGRYFGVVRSESLFFVEVLFLDVVGDGGVEEFGEGFSGGDGFADRGGGDGLMDAVEEMNGGAVEDEVSFGRLLLEGLGDVGGRANCFR